jgi:hypothetical protein
MNSLNDSPTFREQQFLLQQQPLSQAIQIPIEEVDSDPEVQIPNEESSSWIPTLKKAALIGLGILATGAIIYGISYTLSPIPLNASEEQEILNTLCDKAVKSYCKTLDNGNTICLKDYLISNWTPLVTKENPGNYLLCSADLTAPNCTEIVRHTWPLSTDVLNQNYEPVLIQVSKQYFRAASKGLQTYIAKHQEFRDLKDQISFKTHVFCRSTDS